MEIQSSLVAAQIPRVLQRSDSQEEFEVSLPETRRPEEVNAYRVYMLAASLVDNEISIELMIAVAHSLSRSFCRKCHT